MRGINPGEVWIIDFGMAAKVRPALLLTGEPAVDELDLVTVLLHTTALRGNRWELAIDKPLPNEIIPCRTADVLPVVICCRGRYEKGVRHDRLFAK